MRVFGTMCARGVSDDSMKYGHVNADGVLPSHEMVNDLHHRPIEGGRMVKPNMLRWIQRPTQWILRNVVLALSPLSCSVQQIPITVM